MAKVETVLWRCDWCGFTAQPDHDGRMPDTWFVLDGAGVCDDLCPECEAGAAKLVAVVKAARQAGLPFEKAMANQSEDKP